MILENIPCHTDRINFVKNNTIRIKITNRCPFQCNFCHHEGNKESQDIIINDQLITGLNKFYKQMNMTQAHLTGGKPTAYPQLIPLIKQIKSIGFEVKMTTNGQFDQSLLKRLQKAGLSGLNFSIHTLNPIKLGLMQAPQKNFEWGIKALRLQLRNLMIARDLGLRVKINTVVQNDSDIIDIISFCKAESIDLRILDDLNPRSLSIQRIIEILSSMKAVVTGMDLSQKTSSYSYDVTSIDGFKCKIKGIRKNLLRSLCSECKIRANCKEWFYGIRLETVSDKLFVRLCLHRQDFPAIQSLDEFFGSTQYLELIGG